MTAKTLKPESLTPSRRRNYQRVVRRLRSVALRKIVVLGEEGSESRIRIPLEALRLFGQILEQLAAGNAVTVVPHHVEVTTQQAADMLGVSRPYLIKVTESGQIPCRRVGNRRKIRVSDLLAYRDRDDERRRAIADELTRNAQELGLDY